MDKESVLGSFDVIIFMAKILCEWNLSQSEACNQVSEVEGKKDNYSVDTSFKEKDLVRPKLKKMGLTLKSVYTFSGPYLVKNKRTKKHLLQIMKGESGIPEVFPKKYVSSSSVCFIQNGRKVDLGEPIVLKDSVEVNIFFGKCNIMLRSIGRF